MWPTETPRTRPQLDDARDHRVQPLVLQQVGKLRVRVGVPSLYTAYLQYIDQEQLRVYRIKTAIRRMLRRPSVPPEPDLLNLNPGYTWIRADYKMPTLPPPPAPSATHTIRVREEIILAIVVLVLIGFMFFFLKKAEKYMWPTDSPLSPDESPGPSPIPTTLSERIAMMWDPDLCNLPTVLIQDPPRIDLPPPYSECANTGNTDIGTDTASENRQDQPPPYANLAFGKLADEMPSVHYNNENETLNIDTGQGKMKRDQKSAINDAGSSIVNETEDMKFVFENGRIVERLLGNDATREACLGGNLKVREGDKPQIA